MKFGVFVELLYSFIFILFYFSIFYLSVTGVRLVEAEMIPKNHQNFVTFLEELYLIIVAG